MSDETGRRAEDDATEGGKTDYDGAGEADKEAERREATHEAARRSPDVDVPGDATPIGDARYQPGGNPTGDTGRQEGMRIAEMDEPAEEQTED